MTEAVDAAILRTQRPALPAREAEVSKDLHAAITTAEKLTKSLTHTAWRSLALLALPYAVVAALLWTLIIPIAEVLGVGPLSRWAWSSFDNAETAWGRLGVVSAIFGALAALGYGIYQGGKRLAGVYRDWR